MRRRLRGALLFWLLSLPLLASFKYSYVPKYLFEHQVFPLTVIENDAMDDLPRIRLMGAIENAELLFAQPLVIRNGNDRFYTYYFKAKEEGTVRLPPLTIENDAIQTELPAQSIPVRRLQAPTDFCGVLATDMKIRYAQASHYDETHYLVTLSLEAYEANLEDMHLSDGQEQGIENVTRQGAKATADFYLVVPETQKAIAFVYYNTVSNRFKPLRSKVEINDATVVTQTDLNPKENKFEKLKRYSLIGLTALFAVLFLASFDLFYLALSAVTGIILYQSYVPKTELCIQEGTPLYILPTATSDVCTRIDHRMHTVELARHGTYHKIQTKQGSVGWVKDENLCKD